MFQTKEKDKMSEELSELEVSNFLPNKEFKVIIIKMLRELERRADEHNENFNSYKYKEDTNRAEEYDN